MKKSILWFADYQNNTSFSRITQSMLPHMSNYYDITLLTRKPENYKPEKLFKCVFIGEDTDVITYNNYRRGTLIDNPNISSLAIDLQYILIQINVLLYKYSFNYLLMNNGIYEVKWLAEMIKNNPKILINKNKKTKFVIWSPIDYIPSLSIIKNVIEGCDLFLTMTPTMVTTITDIMKCNNIDWIGHGSNITTKEIVHNVVEKLNLEKGKMWRGPKEIKEDDIIILNANNCKKTDRKRLDITVKAYLKLLNNNEIGCNGRLRLWIHTHLLTFLRMLQENGIKISDFKDTLIMSDVNLSDEQMALMYSACKINLQTSTGEGWSLVNMESALFKGLQVVPDFLACKFHFENGKGLLIPVKLENSKNENNDDIVIGVVDVDDVYLKLKEAALMYVNEKEKFDKIVENGYEYAKSYTWDEIANQLRTKLEKL